MEQFLDTKSLGGVEQWTTHPDDRYNFWPTNSLYQPWFIRNAALERLCILVGHSQPISGRLLCFWHYEVAKQLLSWDTDGEPWLGDAWDDMIDFWTDDREETAGSGMCMLAKETGAGESLTGAEESESFVQRFVTSIFLYRSSGPALHKWYTTGLRCGSGRGSSQVMYRMRSILNRHVEKSAVRCWEAVEPLEKRDDSLMLLRVKGSKDKFLRNDCVAITVPYQGGLSIGPSSGCLRLHLVNDI
jgi:hypothetical protein